MEYLSRKSVAFTERNVGRDPKARNELRALGLTSVPVLLIGDQKLIGFDPAKIDAALEAVQPGGR